MKKKGCTICLVQAETGVTFRAKHHVALRIIFLHAININMSCPWAHEGLVALPFAVWIGLVDSDAYLAAVAHSTIQIVRRIEVSPVVFCIEGLVGFVIKTTRAVSLDS